MTDFITSERLQEIRDNYYPDSAAPVILELLKEIDRVHNILEEAIKAVGRVVFS